MAQHHWTPLESDIGGPPSNLNYSQPWHNFHDIFVDIPPHEEPYLENNPEAALHGRPALVFDHGQEGVSVGNDRRAVIFDQLNDFTVGEPETVELYFRMQPVGAGGDSRCVVHQRGGPSNEYGVLGGLHRAGSWADIAGYQNANHTHIADNSEISGGYETWRQRVRLSNNTIRVKVWRDEASEPADWTLTRNVSNFTSPNGGGCGYFQYETSWGGVEDGIKEDHFTHIYEIGIGTGGDPAPTGPLSRERIFETTRYNGMDATQGNQQLALGLDSGYIDIYDLRNSEFTDIIPEGDRHNAVTNATEKTVAFSPDAQYLAVSLDDEITRVFENTDGWPEVASLNAGGRAASWSRDSSMLAVCDASGAAVYDASDWSQIGSTSLSVYGIDFANTKDEIALSRHGGGVLDRRDTSLSQIDSHGVDDNAVTTKWSPNDEYIAVGSENNSIEVVDADTLGRVYYDSESTDETFQLQGSVYAIDFDPTRDWLIYGEGTPNGGLLRLVDTTSWEILDEYYADAPVESAMFYSNGLRVAVADRNRMEILRISGDAYYGIDTHEGVVEHIETHEGDVVAVYVNHGDGTGEHLVWRRA